MMSPMSISCMYVAVAAEASAGVAYSLTLWKIMAMGLVWAYVMFLTNIIFCARDCAVICIHGIFEVADDVGERRDLADDRGVGLC